MFTDKEHRGPFEFGEELGSMAVGAGSEENVIPAQSFEARDNDLLLSTSEKEESRGLSNNDSAYSAPGYDASLISLEDKQGQPESNFASLAVPTMLSQASSVLDDLLGLGTLDTPPPPTLKLNPKAVLDPGSFQRKWGQLATSLSQEFSINPKGVVALTIPHTLHRHMQGHSIQCIASGGQSPSLKFFFFAQKDGENSPFFLVECLINTLSAKAQISIKSEDPSLSEPFSVFFQSALLALSPS